MYYSVVITIFLLLVSSAALADFPENDLWKEDVYIYNDDVSKQKFEEVIDSVIEIYAPIVQGLGGNLVVEKNWSNSTVNAYASRDGSTWNIAMFGGLARRPEVTPDGFILVVCHELGHHIAGMAFYDGNWASSEGQSDYFATHACARKVWGITYRSRVKEASLSLATLLAKLSNEPAPSLSKRDPNVVSEIYESHPSGQCRLDTMIAGMRCSKRFPENLIPGLFGSSVGYNTEEAEAESMKYTCANRPKCWYAKPSF